MKGGKREFREKMGSHGPSSWCSPFPVAVASTSFLLRPVTDGSFLMMILPVEVSKLQSFLLLTLSGTE